MLLTGVNRTQLQRVSNTREEPKPCCENKGKTRCTESQSINLWQNTSGFDSSVLNSDVKDSAQQSSKYFYCSSVSLGDNCKGEGGKILTQYLSCVPLPPDSLFFNVFLLLCGVRGDGWVEESSRWYVSATSTVQSLMFPLSLISSNGNNSVTNKQWWDVFFLHVAFQL